MAFSNVDCTWINAVAGSPSYDETELRRVDAAMFAGAADTADPLKVRGGVVRHASNSLAVTVNASDVVTVQPGAAVIPGDNTSGNGAYRAAIGASQTETLAARDATNSRIDLVVFEVISGGTQARLRVIAGAPSGSPVAPAKPTRAIEVARVVVPAQGAGNASIDASKVNYAVAIGARQVVANATMLPATAVLWEQAVLLDTGEVRTWDGTAWLDGAWASWTPGWSSFGGSAISIGNGTLEGRYMRSGKTVHFDIVLTRGSTTNVGGAAYVFTLPVTARSTNTQGVAFIRDASSPAGGSLPHMWFGISATEIMVVASSGRRIDNNGFGTAPTAWADGDAIRISGTYEAA